MNDELENKLQEKGLNAPRVTPKDIADALENARDIQYHVFPGTTLTVCCITLSNGFCVTGESAAVSKENFNEEIGCDVALDDAKGKLWPLLGYALKANICHLGF